MNKQIIHTAPNGKRYSMIINQGFHKPYQALNELVREGRIDWCKTLNDTAFTIRS